MPSNNIPKIKMEQFIAFRTSEEMVNNVQRIANERMTDVSSLIRLAVLRLVKEYEREESQQQMPAKHVTEGFH